MSEFRIKIMSTTVKNQRIHFGKIEKSTFCSSDLIQFKIPHSGSDWMKIQKFYFKEEGKCQSKRWNLGQEENWSQKKRFQLDFASKIGMACCSASLQACGTCLTRGSSSKTLGS